jgi:hypothetical protein
MVLSWATCLGAQRASVSQSETNDWSNQLSGFVVLVEGAHPICFDPIVDD